MSEPIIGKNGRDGVSPSVDNMLIHGDNLLALKALEETFAEAVKCIYIDSPFTLRVPHAFDTITNRYATYFVEYRACKDALVRGFGPKNTGDLFTDYFRRCGLPVLEFTTAFLPFLIQVDSSGSGLAPTQNTID